MSSISKLKIYGDNKPKRNNIEAEQSKIIKQQDEKIAKLQGEIDDLNEEVDKLNKEVDELNQKNDEFEEKFRKGMLFLNDRINDKVRRFDARNEELENEFEKKFSKNSLSFGNLNNKLKKLEAKCEVLENFKKFQFASKKIEKNDNKKQSSDVEEIDKKLFFEKSNIKDKKTPKNSTPSRVSKPGSVSRRPGRSLGFSNSIPSSAHSSIGLNQLNPITFDFFKNLPIKNPEFGNSLGQIKNEPFVKNEASVKKEPFNEDGPYAYLSQTEPLDSLIQKGGSWY